MYTYDIAVIGGGLAGLCLAIQAAGQGYHVILFEKEHYPFHKVCGEYISFESRPFLLGLGVPLNQWQLPAINTLQTSDVRGNLYEFNLPLGGFGVSRYKLDNFLYELALQKGVKVLCGTKVLDAQLVNEVFTIQTVEGDFYAKLVAGAFGKRSNLDVKWGRSFVEKKKGGLHNYIAVKYHVKYPHQQNTIALHNFHNGYCGLSKVEDDISCLCYLTTAANLLKSGNSIAAMENDILSSNPLLKQIFSGAAFLYDRPLTISQVSFSQKSQVKNHVLLLGDAAGLITPLCGNGMSMAMHASKLAMSAIHAFLQHAITRGEMENAYKTAWQSNFSSRLFTGRMVQQVFGGNQSTLRFLKLMNTFPALANLIIRKTHGKAF